MQNRITSNIATPLPLGLLPDQLLQCAGVAPTARAEELSATEFCALARALG